MARIAGATGSYPGCEHRAVAQPHGRSRIPSATQARQGLQRPSTDSTRRRADFNRPHGRPPRTLLSAARVARGPRSASIRPATHQHRRDRHGQDLQVDRQRRAVDVLQVQADPVGEVDIVFVAHLPRSRDAWAHRETPTLPVLTRGHLTFQPADKAHPQPEPNTADGTVVCVGSRSNRRVLSRARDDSARSSATQNHSNHSGRRRTNLTAADPLRASPASDG